MHNHPFSTLGKSSLEDQSKYVCSFFFFSFLIFHQILLKLWVIKAQIPAKGVFDVKMSIILDNSFCETTYNATLLL